MHDKIEKADESFASVPISSSETSKKLRIAHAQRVISAQLRHIIWQPFSSEATLQDPKYISLFDQISKGLVEFYGQGGGFRAARLCTALIMRGLRSQPSVVHSPPTSASLLGRAEVFVETVMPILSLLVKPSLHPNLRNNLHDIAKSAISVWDMAQTDERQIIVQPTLDPEMFKQPSDISASSGEIIVLFPRITAQSCSRATVPRNRLPGTFEDPEPESDTRETCIYDGVGLEEWSQLVLDGEVEEEERREKEEKTMREERRRQLEEDMKKLESPNIGQRRRMSRNISSPGSGPKPSASSMRNEGVN